MPGPPAKKLAVQVGNQNRQLITERRDFILEVNRMPLVCPKKALIDIFCPKVLEVLSHRRSEDFIRAVKQHIHALPGIEHLDPCLVVVLASWPLVQFDPFGSLPL